MRNELLSEGGSEREILGKILRFGEILVAKIIFRGKIYFLEGKILMEKVLRQVTKTLLRGKT